jgi:hypothetical protein
MSEQRLNAWHPHAARTDGFVGGALRIQRGKTFVMQGQQRAGSGTLLVMDELASSNSCAVDAPEPMKSDTL